MQERGNNSNHITMKTINNRIKSREMMGENTRKILKQKEVK